MPQTVEREQTVGDYLAGAMPDANPRARQRLLKFQRVLVNGSPATSTDALLRPGDTVAIEPPKAPDGSATPSKAEPKAEPRSKPARPERSDDRPARDRPRPPQPQRDDRLLPGGIRIVHEDDDLIVLDKPPGLVTASPVPTREPTVFDTLKDYARQGGSRGRRPPPRPRAGSRGDGPRGAGPPRPWVIHRLDKDASGLLVFAKSEKAFDVLKEDLRAKRMHRLYLALAEGIVGDAGSTGTIQSFLKEDASGRVASISNSDYRGRPPRPPGRGGDGGDRGDAARLAVTHFRVLGAANDLSLVQVRLETGRKNQIRVHFAERGHSLAGDRRHGAKGDAVGRLALHAAELGFAHPSTGQPLRFTSPAPASFYRAVGLPVPAAAVEEAPRPRMAAQSSSHATRVETSWDSVAGWYDELQGEKGSDQYENVILPGALRLLRPEPGTRVLDVACGQGILCRRLAELGVAVTGVEASPRLLEAAKERTGAVTGSHGPVEYLVADARDLGPLGLSGFDSAACIMALSNIEPLEPVIRGIAAALKPGGSLVIVISHPAFRAPGQTAWGWDDKAGRQFRRVDGYLSPGQTPIDMHPGKRARAEPGGDAVTMTFHRPIQAYVKALVEAGLLVESLEEWPGQRVSTSGPRAAEENRARREIPLFMGIRARR